jgi:hypothetical protein
VGWAGSCAVWSRTFATIHPMAWHYQENQDPRGGIDHRIEKTLERLADVNRSPRPTHNAPFTASPRCGIAFRAAIAAPKVLPALTSSLILRAFHTLRSVKDGGSATPPMGPRSAADTSLRWPPRVAVGLPCFADARP